MTLAMMRAKKLIQIQEKIKWVELIFFIYVFNQIISVYLFDLE